MKRTFNQIICDITDALTQTNDEFIEAIANAVLAKKVKCNGVTFVVGGKKPCINDRVLSQWKCPKCKAILKDGQTFTQIAEVGNPICDCDDATEMELHGIEINGYLTLCN